MQTCTQIWSTIAEHKPIIFAFFLVLWLGVSVCASVFIVFRKRDPRSALGWLGITWALPLVGALLFVLLGINRVQRRARKLRTNHQRRAEAPEHAVITPADLFEDSHPNAYLAALAQATDHITKRPLLTGNTIEALINGDEAYPAMLDAIGSAQKTIALQSYLFDSWGIGEQFIQALVAAQKRGVTVRVIVDALGERTRHTSTSTILAERGVPVARFLPVLTPSGWAFANLRNHRKNLIVDGTIGFTGGTNICTNCLLANDPDAPILDTHFKLQGPIVAQLQEVFAEDLAFITEEYLEGKDWFPDIPNICEQPTDAHNTDAHNTDAHNHFAARAIVDGPDENIHVAEATILAAIASARQRIAIATPYFLPDDALTSALQIAALRGIQVDVVVSAKCDLRPINWAMQGFLDSTPFERMRIWRTPGPFDHSKLLTIDGTWSLIGSANLDPRSLRLNFELNVESYDPNLATRIEELIDQRIEKAHPHKAVTKFLPKLRNRCIRLLQPYL